MIDQDQLESDAEAGMSDWPQVGVLVDDAYVFSGLPDRRINARVIEFGGSIERGSSLSLRVKSSEFAANSIELESQVKFTYGYNTETPLTDPTKWVLRRVNNLNDATSTLEFEPVL